jgi:exopolysaccharide biosynthesis polyprenyl glycosylphosphotransferase
MKTLLRRLSVGFVAEDAGGTEAIRTTAPRALTSAMAELGAARSWPATESCLETFVNADFLPPMIEELEDTSWRRYAVAAHSLGRFWLQLRVQAQRLRAVWLANGCAWSKRALDIAVSLALLITLSPLFLLIAALVWLEDRGPVFFPQTRVGQDGTEFKMYKIRSMCRDAEERLRELLGQNHHKEGVTFKLRDDPRITRVGKWLRKFSFDELPQLYNVLIGNMSLVGPRPPVPREVAKYSPAHRRRLAVKPGVTCIWQISGRSEIDFSGQVQLDVDYIENQSFWVDLKLLARTIPAVLSGKGAC